LYVTVHSICGSEDVSWIDLPAPWITIPIANVVVTVAWVVLFAIGTGTPAHFDPPHLYVAFFVGL
jgi:hypothetical protein